MHKDQDRREGRQGCRLILIRQKLMEDKELIDKIRALKEERRYTLYDLSKRLDIQVPTIERWLKTNRINRVYGQLVREKLRLS